MVRFTSRVKRQDFTCQVLFSSWMEDLSSTKNIKTYVLRCTTIRFKQKYGHRSRHADMNLRCKSESTAEIGQYFVGIADHEIVLFDAIPVGIFSCDQAALQMVFSVCLSVHRSVCLSHLFDYVPIIISSWNFQELLPMTKVRSMQNVRGQRSRSQRSQPNLTVSGL